MLGQSGTHLYRVAHVIWMRSVECFKTRSNWSKTLKTLAVTIKQNKLHFLKSCTTRKWNEVIFTWNIRKEVHHCVWCLLHCQFLADFGTPKNCGKVGTSCFWPLVCHKHFQIRAMSKLCVFAAYPHCTELRFLVRTSVVGDLKLLDTKKTAISSFRCWSCWKFSNYSEKRDLHLKKESALYKISTGCCRKLPDVWVEVVGRCNEGLFLVLRIDIFSASKKKTEKLYKPKKNSTCLHSPCSETKLRTWNNPDEECNFFPETDTHWLQWYYALTTAYPADLYDSSICGYFLAAHRRPNSPIYSQVPMGIKMTAHFAWFLCKKTLLYPVLFVVSQAQHSFADILTLVNSLQSVMLWTQPSSANQRFGKQEFGQRENQGKNPNSVLQVSIQDFGFGVKIQSLSLHRLWP